MLKSLSKYLPKVAWFFVIAASLVTLWDWILSDIVSATSLIKFWIVTAIIVIITLFVTGVLSVGDVKDKAKVAGNKINECGFADTIFAVLYFILIFLAVMFFGTKLAAWFHWNNTVTYWIAMKFDETKALIIDLVALVAVYVVDKLR